MDSDAAAPAALPVRPSSSVPRKSSLKPRSKSRPRSRHRHHLVIVLALACPRSVMTFTRKKPAGSLPSSHFAGFTSHDVSPKPVYQLDPMPVDLNDPAWKADFLAWTLRDMRKSWRAGERAWVNLHIALTSTTQLANIQLRILVHLRHVPLQEMLLYLRDSAVGRVRTSRLAALPSLFGLTWMRLHVTGTRFTLPSSKQIGLSWLYSLV